MADISTLTKTEPNYSDSLITIRENGILFKNHYFFWHNKFVPFDNIEQVKVLKPTISTGKWRWHGTGDFQYWFPADYKRHKRDAIFIAYIRGKGMDIGFTVEDSFQVTHILRQKGLINNADIQSEGTSEVSLRTKPRGQMLFIGIILFRCLILPLISILLVIFLE